MGNQDNTPSPTTSGGVDELIGRLQQDGIEAGREQAETLVRQARVEADRIIQEAREQAQQVLDKGRQQLATERQAVQEALRQASRDALLTLQTDLASRLKARIEELCEQQLDDPAFLKALLLSAVGREVPQDARVELELTTPVEDASPDPNRADEATRWLQGEMQHLLRDGVSLQVRAGRPAALRLQLIGQDARIDITSETLADLVWQVMIPRYRHMLSFGR